MEDDMIVLQEMKDTDRVLDDIGSGQLASSPDPVINVLIAWRREVLRDARY